MTDHNEVFVAFDTSKLRNAVAIAEWGRAGEVRFLGEIENTETATSKLARKLAAKYRLLTFCDESGPTRYDLHRLIKSLGHDCIVVAPSGAVAGVVGIEGGVVSEVINLESSGVGAPDRRPRHDQRYHEERFPAA